MSSTDAHVLAGRVGSEKRTKKINMMLDELDRAVSRARDPEDGQEIEMIKISSSYLATRLNYSRSTITKNGFPHFFTEYFDSIEYRENKGLYIEIEKYVEERKNQREKVAELKQKNE